MAARSVAAFDWRHLLYSSLLECLCDFGVHSWGEGLSSVSSCVAVMSCCTGAETIIRKHHLFLHSTRFWSAVCSWQSDDVTPFGIRPCHACFPTAHFAVACVRHLLIQTKVGHQQLRHWWLCWSNQMIQLIWLCNRVCLSPSAFWSLCSAFPKQPPARPAICCFGCTHRDHANP